MSINPMAPVITGNLFGNGSSLSSCQGVPGNRNCSSPGCHCAGGFQACTNTGCLGGCRDGWMGSSCNIQCTMGTWGANCTLYCGTYCQNNTCDPEDGFCICMPGAPVIDCTPSPENRAFLLTTFWLTVVILSLVSVIIMVVCGFTCRKPYLAKKRKVLNVVFRKSTTNGKMASKGVSTNTMMDSPQLRMLRNSIAMRKPNFIRKISRPSNSSNFQGSVHSSLGSGESQGRPNRKASRLSTGPGSGVQTNSTQFAKELAVAMPDYKIQFDQNGELKIMRREAGKKLDKESIKRIIVQKAHNVKAKVRKKAESHSGRASMDVVDKKNLSLRRESIDKVLEKKASKVSSVRLSSRAPPGKLS
ncbi:hypothetical protein RRG08_014435 [Elysia crispata]|uniref:Uncharacterized protein n=1 Tax=Elysia crispata TaxID=231223 RepID=A0AAE0YV40_9GAST|nr:hypothetical protein RRG08_014435 [Elysia crispata]